MSFKSFQKILSVAVVTNYSVMVTDYRRTVTLFFLKFLVVTDHPLMGIGYCKAVANLVSIFDMVTGYQVWVTSYPVIIEKNSCNSFFDPPMF